MKCEYKFNVEGVRNNPKQAHDYDEVIVDCEFAQQRREDDGIRVDTMSFFTSQKNAPAINSDVTLSVEWVPVGNQ